jgi:glutamate synthase (NADPH) small chain
MDKRTGFLQYRRELPTRRPVEARVQDWDEIYNPFPILNLQEQAARCMDCGVPFCHQGCPLGNMIPDWNDFVYRDMWRKALDFLHATNNFPEFTGRLCPAPCESSCVLAINSDAVTIKQIEVSIIDRAWEEGWVRPEPPARLTGKKVAVIGSGPAGLACGQQLRRAGHEVAVFERADKAGGLLRYGIPQFKMEKRFLDRRLEQMEAEGVTFLTGVDVGADLRVEDLRREFDALVLAGGANAARDVPIPGSHLRGIHQAMEFLPMGNRFALGEVFEEHGYLLVKPTPPYAASPEPVPYVTATGKRVIIVGGGDTGADCLGTVHRQGCHSVHQFQIHPRPPDGRAPHNPWPQWDNVFRVSGAHEEGCEREFSIRTVEYLGNDRGYVTGLQTIRVQEEIRDGRAVFSDVPGTEQVYPADLVLLAIGFAGPERGGMLEQLGVEFDVRGNVKTNHDRMTGIPGVFAAGDMARGQSLIVWAIAEGRQAAAGVDEYLMGTTALPRPLDFGNDERPFFDPKPVPIHTTDHPPVEKSEPLMETVALQ